MDDLGQADASSANITQPYETQVSEILDQRNEARRWMQVNYWDIWEEVYRFSKCKTRPLMRRDDRLNKDVEDKTRTNVCMPETSLTIRRKTARLTAQPPQINYTSSTPNDELSLKLTAWAYQQFDRSGEAAEHRKLINTAVSFGYAVSKLSWESVQATQRWTKAFIGRDSQVAYRDRRGVMAALGAPPDEVDDMVDQLGPDLSDVEVAHAMQKLGEWVQVKQQLKLFDGPMARNVFIGDIFLEPGCQQIDWSGWVIENYWETERWLSMMAQKTYMDPETGQEVPVFDPVQVRRLSDMGSWNPNQGTQQPYDLRTRFRTDVLNQTVPLFPTRLLHGKRFDILERHMVDKYGTMWMEWVGNEAVFLGKMPYPFDLRGKTVYSELVPLPDLIGFVGDSIPMLHRFLQMLHNSTVGQRKDLVSAILRPMMLLKAGEDIPDEFFERKLMRVLEVKNLDSIRPLIENPVISEAIGAAANEESQVLRMWGLSDPSLNNTESGTDINPQAGKTATTAVLAAKSADALTQFELDSVHIYLKEVGEKKLWMLQQRDSDNPEEGFEVGSKYASKVNNLAQQKGVEGWVERYTGKVSSMTIYPDELQQEFEVEPEAMSMLSVDDDIRRQSAMAMVQAAAGSPQSWDQYYVNRFYASTIRGVDPDKAVPPPKPPAPPAPEIKISMSVSAKFEDLPAEVQAQILQSAQITVTPELQAELQHSESLRGVGKVAEAANAAHDIMEPSSYSGPETPMSKGVNGG